MMEFDKIQTPQEGQIIQITDGKLVFPDDPIIPFIEGDGIGPDISRAMLRVLDAAVAQGRVETLKLQLVTVTRELYRDLLYEDIEEILIRQERETLERYEELARYELPHNAPVYR